MKFIKTLSLVLCLIAILSAHAVNKCVEADGKTIYTDEPCPDKSVASRSVKTNFTKLNPLGSGPLSVIYAQHVKAMKAGDRAAFLSNASENVRVSFDGQGAEKFQYHIEKNLPVSYEVTLEKINDDKTQGSLGVKVVMSEKSSNKAGSGMDLYMLVQMVNEQGTWKIESETSKSFKRETKHMLNNPDESWRIEAEQNELDASRASYSNYKRGRR
jgi:Domain of unknown function (DUF4124)